MTAWPSFTKRRRRETELDAELVDHLERQAEDYVMQGLSREVARRRARVEFGGVAQTKEACRAASSARWCDEWAHDLRYAVRDLVRDRAFTIVAVAALGLGIGVYNMQFAILNAICIRGLPIARADRVFYLSSRDARNRDSGVSVRDFEDFRAGTRAFEGLAAFSVGPVAVGDEARTPDRALGAFVSADAFALVGERPALGRDFRLDDDRPGALPVTILGGGLWKSRYAADPAIVGRSIRINGAPVTVVGVMPDGFKFPGNADLWQPLSLMPGYSSQPRDARGLGAFARLRDDAGLSQAQTELQTVAVALAQAHPEMNRDIRPWLMPINERFNGRLSDPTWQAFIVVGVLVALIACANVANLLLARSARRAREIAIRASLGATRLRIVRQLLVESLLLAVCGALAGLAVSAVGLRLFSRAIPENGLPYWVTLTMDARVYAGLALMALGTVLVFGLVPALLVSKTDLHATLKEGGAHSRGVRSRRWTTWFLTLEFALTMVLLSAVATGWGNLRAAQRADQVIDPKPLVSMWVTLPAQPYPSAAARAAFFERLGERLSGIPELTAWTLTSALPFSGAASRAVVVDGRAVEPGVAQPTASIVSATPGYFETLRLSLEQGRAFVDDDGDPGRLHAIVNRQFVRQYFPTADPIGRVVAVTMDTGPKAVPTAFTIVGVSLDVRQRSPLEPEPVVYLPARWTTPETVAIVIRTTRPEALVPHVREEVRALNPDLPVYRVLTLEQALWEARFAGRVSNSLASTITLVALLLALVGLYAVTAQSVLQRTPEIGIRSALGASSSRIVGLVLRQALARLGVGITAGFACTWVWERWFGDVTAPNRTTDPATFVPMAALLIAVAMLACLVPVGRASRIDPVIALRAE